MQEKRACIRGDDVHRMKLRDAELSLEPVRPLPICLASNLTITQVSSLRDLRPRSALSVLY